MGARDIPRARLSLRVGTHQGWDFAGRNVMLYSDGATGSGVWPKLHWCLCARLRVWLPALADLTLVKWAHEMRVPLSRSGDYRSFSAPAQPVAHRWSDAWNSLAFCISCMSRPYTGRGKGGCVVGPPKNTSIYVSQEESPTKQSEPSSCAPKSKWVRIASSARIQRASSQ